MTFPRTAIVLTTLLCCARAAENQPLVPVPIRDVVIDDAFWSPKIKVWNQKTIHDVFDKFEKYGGFRNFDRVAAGEKGGHQGDPWWDGLIYETIRAAGDFLSAHPDPELEKRVNGFIDRIAAAAAKDPDGYVNTAQQLNGIGIKWSNPPAPGDRHDDNVPHTVYNAGCLVEAAVHYHRGTGDTKLLKVATRLANYMCGIMGPPPKQNIIPGHAISEESFVELYRLYRDTPGLKEKVGLPVNEKDYLSLAGFWIENRGKTEGRDSAGAYNQDHKPVFEQATLEGHAVRSVLLATGMATAAVENGRADYRKTLERWWENMVDARMYLTGGLGAIAAHEGFGHDHELPNDGYAETCAAVSGGLFSHKMNLLTADAKYVDTLEREIYNGALSGVSLEGNTYFYTNPLSAGPDHRRWDWAGPGLGMTPCCPPMFLKLTSALPGYIYATRGEAVYVNLFIGSKASIKAGELTLQQTTRYPWDGTVELALTIAKPSEFPLHLRIPNWAKKPELQINGKAAERVHVSKGYAVITRTWKSGDKITLKLPMPVERVKADPKVAANQGRVAIMRGPLVYCFEGIDHGGSNQAILLGSGDVFKPVHKPDLLGGVVELETRTTMIRHLDGRTLKEPVTAKAIPFYANQNRAATHMDVWLADDPAAVRPARDGTPSASQCHGSDTVDAINDGVIPKSSDDESIPRMTWWDHKGSGEWAQITWDAPREISYVEVYWWDERRIQRDCRVPASWSVQYLNSTGEWTPVEKASGFPTEPDRFNKTTFQSVKTEAIRIIVRLQDGWSGGILEARAGR